MINLYRFCEILASKCNKCEDKCYIFEQYAENECPIRTNCEIVTPENWIEAIFSMKCPPIENAKCCNTCKLYDIYGQSLICKARGKQVAKTEYCKLYTKCD